MRKLEVIQRNMPGYTVTIKSEIHRYGCDNLITFHFSGGDSASIEISSGDVITGAKISPNRKVAVLVGYNPGNPKVYSAHIRNVGFSRMLNFHEGLFINHNKMPSLDDFKFHASGNLLTYVGVDGKSITHDFTKSTGIDPSNTRGWIGTDITTPDELRKAFQREDAVMDQLAQQDNTLKTTLQACIKKYESERSRTFFKWQSDNTANILVQLAKLVKQTTPITDKLYSLLENSPLNPQKSRFARILKDNGLINADGDPIFSEKTHRPISFER